jgi:hypothetical protein
MSQEIIESAEPKGEIILYQTADGRVKLDVKFHDDSVWLTKQMMADLYQTSKQNISYHISSVYEEGELQTDRTSKNYLLVQKEGQRQVQREADFYNLEMIIAVGYRVKSKIATRFRVWATEHLKEYLIKGFVLNDERLKNPPTPGSSIPDYFDEMLERIRDIRASERRMYLRVKEIFALATDYDSTDSETQKYFSIMQNKLHFAVSGKTAAEIVKSRADHQSPNMGLTSWKGDEVRKTDVTIAKNYLTESEIAQLNRIVVMWLDYAEDQANRRRQIHMKDWEEKLNNFLEFNERQVLTSAGKVSKIDAEDYAKQEYDKFAERRREYKESLGEVDYEKQLEEAAKELTSNNGDNNLEKVDS